MLSNSCLSLTDEVEDHIYKRFNQMFETFINMEHAENFESDFEKFYKTIMKFNFETINISGYDLPLFSQTTELDVLVLKILLVHLNSGKKAKDFRYESSLESFAYYGSVLADLKFKHRLLDFRLELQKKEYSAPSFRYLTLRNYFPYFPKIRYLTLRKY